jgi:hypothetical protein
MSSRAAGFCIALLAAGAVGFTVSAGRRNPSLLLIVLFAGWVSSAFVPLWASVARSSRDGIRLPILVTAAAQSGVYAYAAFFPLRETPARVFLLTPVAGWIAGAFFLLHTRSSSEGQR